MRVFNEISEGLLTGSVSPIGAFDQGRKKGGDDREHMSWGHMPYNPEMSLGHI